MKLYQSYIIKNLIAPILVLTAALTLIVWFTRAMQLIDLVVNNGVSVLDFLFLSSLSIPLLLLIIIPVATFIGTIYSYNKLMHDNELIVFSATGLSNISLAKPAIKVAILLALFNFFISAYLLPNAYQKFKDMQFIFKNTPAISLIQPGIFNTPKRGLTIYVDKITPDGLLQGILVYDRSKDAPTTIIAEQGNIVNADEGIFLEVLSGFIERDDKYTNILSFDSYSINLTAFKNQEMVRRRKTEEMTIFELLSPDEEGYSKEQIDNLKAEGHHRIIWPIHSIGLALLALAFLLPSQFSRHGQLKKIIFASVTMVIILSVDMGFKSLAAKNSFYNILMYVNGLFPIIISMLILLKSDSAKEKLDNEK